jgi:decaprenylphospho-beta-D-ribofuranose 2-oxidase
VTLLTGWGRTAPTACRVVRPTSTDDVLALLAGDQTGRGLIPRGLGRSYGDPAQNGGGVVIDTTGLDRILAVDPGGSVRVQPGVSLDTLMRVLLPNGWFVPVTPGTRQVSVGGALAADIHGKNHHRVGSIGRHVSSLTMALADATVVQVTPQRAEDLFWATLGGLGLTGVVLEAQMSLVAVQTTLMTVDTRRGADLDAVLGHLADADRRSYSVAWLDSLASGRHTGRGVVTAAEHTTADELTGPAKADPLRFDPATWLVAPPWAPAGLLNRATIGAFNDAWYAKAPRHRDGEHQQLAGFFHPLDGVRGWNRLYGPNGVVQYQCVVPDEAALRKVLERFAVARAPSFLTVLKRFGASTPGPLSFPRPGWTLALDLPAATAGLAAVLDDVDRLVADCAGSVYLAKDSRTRPELLAAFYPRLDHWRAVRDRVDPQHRLMSDLARRLSL